MPNLRSFVVVFFLVHWVHADQSTELRTDSNSLDRRADKSFFAGVQLLGSSVSFATGSGVHAGYFLSPETLVEIYFNSGSGSNQLSSGSGVLRDRDSDDPGSAQVFMYENRAELDATAAFLGVKRFLGNTFYAKAGLMYRDLAFRGTTELGRFSANSQSTGIEVSIGNQWQWRYFTIGCDWIGYMQTISTTDPELKFVENNRVSSRSLLFADKNSDHETVQLLWDELAAHSSFQLLRLYVGASF